MPRPSRAQSAGLDLEHYLDVLERKPAVLIGSKALVAWRKDHGHLRLRTAIEETPRPLKVAARHLLPEAPFVQALRRTLFIPCCSLASVPRRKDLYVGTGPDLTQGIDFAIVDDGMLLGHVKEEPVLLIRRGDALFAIGAECPHYGAPLDEGLLVGRGIS